LIVPGLPSSELLAQWVGAPCRIEPSSHAALFRQHTVFLVRADNFTAFRHCQLAHSSRSVGLCAFDGEVLTYLHAEEGAGLR